MLALPDELIIRIFKYLDLTSLRNISSVNRRMNALSRADHIWKPRLIDNEIKIGDSYYNSFVYHYNRDQIYIVNVENYYHDSTHVAGTLLDANKIIVNDIIKRPHFLDGGRLKLLLRSRHPKCNRRLDHFIKKLQSGPHDESIKDRKYRRHYNSFLKIIPDYLQSVKKINGTSVRYSVAEFCRYEIIPMRICRSIESVVNVNDISKLCQP